MDIKYSNSKKTSQTEDRLEQLKRKEEEDLAQILSERYGYSYVNLAGISIDTDALRIIPEERAKNANIAAFTLNNKKINLAIKSPNKPETINEIKELENRGYIVEIYLVSMLSLEKAWERYKDISFATEAKAGSLQINSDQISNFIKEVRSLEKAKELIKEVLGQNKAFRISRIVEIIVSAGIAVKASDIHVEPEDEAVRLRFRLDGVLQEVIVFDFETYNLLLSRIKLLSGLKINKKNEAQDGRFSVSIDKTEIEIRSSVLPGNNGESIVMRLLDPTSLTVPIEDLGVPPELLKLFLDQVDKPNGMILNTGPTGSGKTTTLYSFINRKKSPEIKIITIEDPIEYHLQGIVQTQVARDKNYDFASGLRSSLRQDPDVIMVGEIRDLETAETAIHAALTGHLVFSTLHTNTAAGAYPRLIDLGVNSRILTSAINLIIAQRLVRKLCKECRKESEMSEEEAILIKNIFDSIKNKNNTEFTTKTYTSAGCEKCNHTGFKGRLGIFEAVINNNEIEEAVQNNPSEREIKKITQEQGLNDLAQDGVLKILNGITTISEVKRVVDLQKREGKMEIEEPKVQY